MPFVAAMNQNDGKIHGPLRLGEIRFEVGAVKDAGRLESGGATCRGHVPLQPAVPDGGRHQEGGEPDHVRGRVAGGVGVSRLLVI